MIGGPSALLMPAALPLGVTTLTTSVTAAVAQVQLQDAGTGTAVGLWLARAGNYLALTAAVGFLVAAVAMLPGRARLAGSGLDATRCAGIAAACWAVSAAGLFVFGTSNASARPLPDALQPLVLAQFAGTRFGTAVLAQGAVALVVAGVALGTKTRAGAAAALAGAAAGGFAPAWWGHAGTKDLRAIALANDWLHVLAVTVWMGGLLALAWLVVRHRDLPLAAPLSQFSRVAGWALGAVLVTGMVNVLLGMSDPAQLTGTTWGRLVLVKVALLAGLAWLGLRQRQRVLPRLRSNDERPATLQMFRNIALAEIVLMVAGIGAATSMASGIPADAEAAARIQSIVAVFGDGQINLTVDPAVAGEPNYVHLYFLADTGQQRDDVTDPSLIFEASGRSVEADLLVAGPGHWSAPSVTLPAPGTWQVQVTATIDGQPTRASGAVTIR